MSTVVACASGLTNASVVACSLPTRLRANCHCRSGSRDAERRHRAGLTRAVARPSVCATISRARDRSPPTASRRRSPGSPRSSSHFAVQLPSCTSATSSGAIVSAVAGTGWFVLRQRLHLHVGVVFADVRDRPRSMFRRSASRRRRTQMSFAGAGAPIVDATPGAPASRCNTSVCAATTRPIVAVTSNGDAVLAHDEVVHRNDHARATRRCRVPAGDRVARSRSPVRNGDVDLGVGRERILDHQPLLRRRASCRPPRSTTVDDDWVAHGRSRRRRHRRDPLRQRRCRRTSRR